MWVFFSEGYHVVEVGFFCRFDECHGRAQLLLAFKLGGVLVRCMGHGVLDVVRDLAYRPLEK